MDARQSRAAVFAHFDPDGVLAPHVRRSIIAVGSAASRLVVVSTATLTQESRDWIRQRAELIERPNTGHDFASYRAGLEHLDTTESDVILMNDSVVFIRDIADLLATMNQYSADFSGITPGYGFEPHVQSYFVRFSRRVVEAEAWSTFWSSIGMFGDREDVILRGEVNLTRSLVAAGFTFQTYFQPAMRERWRGAARAHASELRAAIHDRRVRGIAGWVRRLPRRSSHPEWNVTAALADLAAVHPERLPIVKLSVLRQDPYALGTRQLLAALERSEGAEVEGVRAFLDRTDATYGGAWAKTTSRIRGPMRYRIPRSGTGRRPSP